MFSKCLYLYCKRETNQPAEKEKTTTMNSQNEIYNKLEREHGDFFFQVAEENGILASKIRQEITNQFTDLQGTAKQINWAKDIRNDLRDRNIRWYVLHKLRPGVYTEEQVEEIFAMIKKWLKKSNVKVFIDFRGTKMFQVAERRVVKGK